MMTIEQKIEGELEQYFREEGWLITKGRHIVATHDNLECDECGEPVYLEMNLSTLAARIAERIKHA